MANPQKSTCKRLKLNKNNQQKEAQKNKTPANSR